VIDYPPELYSKLPQVPSAISPVSLRTSFRPYLFELAMLLSPSLVPEIK